MSRTKALAAAGGSQSDWALQTRRSCARSRFSCRSMKLSRCAGTSSPFQSQRWRSSAATSCETSRHRPAAVMKPAMRTGSQYWPSKRPTMTVSRSTASSVSHQARPCRPKSPTPSTRSDRSAGRSKGSNYSCKAPELQCPKGNHGSGMLRIVQKGTDKELRSGKFSRSSLLEPGPDGLCSF
jgi:hypothetical protein